LFGYFGFEYILVSGSNVLYIEIFDIQGVIMIAATQKDLTKYLFADSDFSEEVEHLEKEGELLGLKIEDLMEVEQELLVRISNALFLRRRRNEELKGRVKLLEQKCEELTEFLQNLVIHH